MIRVLVIVAAMGFLVSVVCLCAAVGIAGPQVIANGGWTYGLHDGEWAWGRHWDREERGPGATREIVWTGGDSLEVDLPADVQYTQSTGPAKFVVTGPSDAVADVKLEDGHVSFRDDRHHRGRLTIALTAPSVSRFGMDGDGKLVIANYRQDKLAIDLSGDGEVVAKGAAKAIDLTISGSADADLSEVAAQSATVNIEGSGDATLAPADQAKIEISGSGDVTLLTHPKILDSNVSGSGTVRQEDRPAPAPSPSPPKT